METTVWGIVILICGVFIAVYGNILFKFVLAFIGFALGFSLVMWLGGAMSDALKIVVAIVVGGILAAVMYSLLKFALYIGGAILGTVLIVAVLGLFKLGGLDLGFFGWILAAVGAIAGGFVGPRLGNLVIVLATSLAGAYFTVLGLGNLFKVSVDTENPLTMLGTGFPLVLFLTVTVISFLGQYESHKLRQRFLR
jgi:hypothetical protein